MLRCGESGFPSTLLGAAAIVSAALFAGGLLFVWARRPGHPERGPVLIAAATLGVTTGSLNLILGMTGIWQSCSYTLPLPVVATYYLLLPIVFGTLLLLGYRWLDRHARHARLAYGALVLVVFGPLIAFGDRVAIDSGILEMRGGYAIWMDVTLGIALFWLPVIVYAWIRSRRGHVP